MIALSRPSPGNITERFGPRPKPTPTSPAIHYGIDFGWGNGTAIYAAADGVVTSTSYSGAYGYRTVINHGGGVETWYCHQSSQLVKVGATVKRGQHIGTQGATGNVTGMHLHFELRINGVATDPAPFMSTTASNGQTPIEVDDMQLSDLVEVDDDKGGKQKVYFGVLLNHLFVHVNRAANNAEAAAKQARDQPFGSTAMKDGAGKPALVTMGILADHTRVIVGGLDEQLKALRDSIANLSAPSAGGAQIDYAALAKAVNDDAARRLAS